MAAARRVVESDRFTLKGSIPVGAPACFGRGCHGKTLGLVGLGRIGKAVAKRAYGFDMKVLYYDLHRLSPEEEKALNLTYVSLPELLQTSDFVSSMCP